MLVALATGLAIAPAAGAGRGCELAILREAAAFGGNAETAETGDLTLLSGLMEAKPRLALGLVWSSIGAGMGFPRGFSVRKGIDETGGGSAR